MNRFISTIWLAWVLGAIALLLVAGSIVSAQAPPPQRETVLSGFLACAGVNGERQCPSRLHYVDLVQGQTYAFRVESTEFNTWIQLEDERGNMLATDTDDFDAMPGCMVFRAPATASYRLMVAGRAPLNEGMYMVRIRELPVIFRVEDVLTPSDTQVADCHVRRYDVPLLAGHRYVIDLASSDFSPYLKLLDTDGMIVAFQDESSAPRGARIVFTPTRDATFRIVATTFEPNHLGAFQLSVSRAE